MAYYYKDENGQYQQYSDQINQYINKPEAKNEFILPKGEDLKPYSGLPESYRDQLLGFVMPQLQQSVENLPGNIDAYTQNSLGTYRQELDSYLKENIPKVIGDLAKRGILDSSMASDIISKTTSQAALGSATKGYETAQKAAELKLNIPNTLAGLLEYGRYNEDPTVMYQTMAQLLASI